MSCRDLAEIGQRDSRSLDCWVCEPPRDLGPDLANDHHDVLAARAAVGRHRPLGN